MTASGLAESIHRPGFLQVDELPRWYAHAGAFVLPSLLEPWGLVANEAAASGLPLVVSDRAGCSATLVPGPHGTTGARFDPRDVDELAETLAWIASSTAEALEAMGRRAAEVVSFWGPGRFADGVVQALEFARNRASRGLEHRPSGSRPHRGEPMNETATKSHQGRRAAAQVALDSGTAPGGELATPLQRPRPAPRRRHGAQYPGDDGCTRRG